MGEVNFMQTSGDLIERRGVQPGACQDNAQGIDVAAGGHSSQQGGFNDGGSASHERIIDDLAGIGQPLDEKARQLRFETGAIGNLVQAAGGALFGSPELVDESWNTHLRPARQGDDRLERLGGLAKAFKRD